MTACDKPGRGEYGTISPAMHIIQQSQQTIDEDNSLTKFKYFSNDYSGHFKKVLDIGRPRSKKPCCCSCCYRDSQTPSRRCAKSCNDMSCPSVYYRDSQERKDKLGTDFKYPCQLEWRPSEHIWTLTCPLTHIVRTYKLTLPIKKPEFVGKELKGTRASIPHIIPTFATGRRQIATTRHARHMSIHTTK